MRLLLNRIQCNKCLDIIESLYTHDYRSCSCGECFVDGGVNYRRVMGKYTDMAVIDDGKHEIRREYMKWGRNYDKDMNKLPETQYIAIEDLYTNHIEKILEIKNLNKFYREVLMDELKYRQ